MFARMIRKDVSRNRAVTVVLVVLMAISVLLATASAGVLVRLAGASGQLLSTADAPHVVQLHAGDLDEDVLQEWVAGRDDVAHQHTQLMLGIDGAELFFDGEAQTTSIQQNSLVVPNAERDLLLDLDNQPLTTVEPGTIVLPVIYQIESDLQVGDIVSVRAADGFEADLTVAAFARDSTMNPAIASSKRLAVAPEDLAEIQAHTGTPEHLIAFWLKDPDTQLAAFKHAYQDTAHDLPRSGQLVDRGTFQILTMIGDGLVAGVIILVSLLLLVVGMLCLRFSFLTASEQDIREIGVLKAIGVPGRAVKRIYLVKYAVLVAVAAVLGLVGGMALTPLLTRNITAYMGTAPSMWNWLVPVLAALAVVGLLLLFVVLLLRRFNRISAVEALRPGVPTQRRARGPRLRLRGSRGPVHLRLATMDVLARGTTYVLLLFVFAASTLIAVTPANSATTVTSNEFVSSVGMGPVDLGFDLRRSGPETAGQLAAIEDHLAADPDVTEFVSRTTTRNATTDADGNRISLYVENGDHTVLPLSYAEGRAPAAPDEIALSLLALNETGTSVGDTLPLTVGGQVRDLRVVGSYQDVTNGGTTAKAVLPTEGEQVMWHFVGVTLADDVDPVAKARTLGEQFAPATVADIDRWTGQTLGPMARQIVVVAVVAALVAVALAVLMTSLFTRMLVARDTGQIAIQRAIGADDDGLRLQYVARILIVLVLGVVLGTVAANTIGQGAFNLLFEAVLGGFETMGQGTSKITFTIQPLLAYVALPAALAAAVALAARSASARAISRASVTDITTE